MDGKKPKQGNVGQQIQMNNKDKQRETSKQRSEQLAFYRPIHRLNEARNKDVLVTCKDKGQYRGILCGWDNHFNICLDNAEYCEPEAKEFTSLGGAILIRGDQLKHVHLPNKG